MNNKLIDENGILNIEDLLENNVSLQRILADNHVSTEEKLAQFDRVVEILKKIEARCSEDEIELVRELMAELSALILVCQHPTTA